MSKHVLITGAARGIGAATARVFAQEGWDVSVHYNTSRKEALALALELNALGVRTAPIQADVSVPETSAQMVRTAEEALGPLNALVCNAGMALPQQLFTDTAVEQWQQVMAVDLSGMFHTLRAAVPGMIRQKHGAIVTVSSMWGVTGGSCEVPYSAAKAGVIGLTKALAKELGPSHIRVNCVAPGVVSTAMNDHLTPEDLSALADETPLGRIGRPEEIAQAIFFLASDRASFITGQILRVDGGMVI